jgi:hypothetical protein
MLLQQQRDVKEGKVYQAKVYDVTESTAGVIFCGKDGRKEVKNPDRAVIVVNCEIEDGEKFGETFSLPQDARSWANSKFKLNQFVRKYGDLQYIGMKVQVIIDGDGYYRIAI